MSLSDNESTPSKPPPAPAIIRSKSPPLAFEKSPNDALVPPTDTKSHRTESLASPSPSSMGRRSPLSLSGSEQDLQAIIDQQANTISKLHEAFAEERKTWMLEKERFYNRIASLEQLLKSGDHYSPAKSPDMTASPAGDIVSPTSRALAAAQTLPTISEDDNIPPLSSRRDGAPHSIQLPPALAGTEGRRSSAVTFTDPDGFKVEEIPGGATRLGGLSPPPPMNRMMAGHTPVRAPRAPTPPPGKMNMDGIDDTPTRHNTHINTQLTQSNDEDEDRALKGPLNMPELPHKADDSNFTLEALSKRLEQIEKHPETGRPMVFNQPSPGLASPASEKEAADLSPRAVSKSVSAIDSEVPFAPIATRTSDMPGSELSSNARSPRNGSTMSPQEEHEELVHKKFEDGGVRLKKKTSVNFGAPLGSLGFASSRKMSHEKS